jgi:cold shock CspA family protein
MDTQRIIGTVAAWNVAKGYGFATADGIDQRIYVHRSQIRQSAELQIIAFTPGTKINFVLAENAQGLQALDVDVSPARVRWNLTQGGQTVVRTIS